MSATAILMGWLLHATVKGSVVILLVAFVLIAIGRRVDAKWRHALWLVALLRLVAPSAPSSTWSIFNLVPSHDELRPPVRAVVVPAMGQRVITEPIAIALMPGSLVVWKWIGAVWALGALVLLLRALVASLRTQMAVRAAIRASTTADLTERSAVVAIVRAAERKLGIGRETRVVETRFVKTPALHGLIQPTLLFPEGLLDSFEVSEIRHVVLHELWHLRRRDVAVSWLLTLIQAIHWFNPFVWFAIVRIHEERELACDELALSCLELDERRGYGTTILKLLERFRAAAPVPALVGIVNHKQKMKRRLTMIASFRNRSRFSLLFVAALTVVGVLGLTDASGGEKHMLRKMDPAAMETVGKLHDRVSFDLTNASLNDLLNALSNKTGVTFSQSAGIASSPVQAARFTVHADNVPAHAVLMESLIPFQLAPEPDANGVTIAEGSAHMRIMMAHHRAPADGAQTFEHRVVVQGDKATASGIESEAATRSTASDRIMFRNMRHGGGEINADGSCHRQLTITVNENGVESTGKLTIDVTGAKAAK